MLKTLAHNLPPATLSHSTGLTDRDTGAFKGCGFVEFVDPASIDKVAPFNGGMLLGRALRVDYSAPRKPKEW